MKYIYKGKTAYKQSKVSESCFYNRLERGRSISEAINKPTQSGKGKYNRNAQKHRINGKGLKDYCKDVGIKYSSVFTRMIRKGTTLQESVDYFLSKK